MSLFNKLLKKKQELEKELKNSKVDDNNESETSSEKEISETDSDETVSESLTDITDTKESVSASSSEDDYDEEDDEEDDDEVSEEEAQETIRKVTQILMDNGFYSSGEESEQDDALKLSDDPNVRYLQEKLRNLHIDRTLFIVPVTKKGDDLSNPLNDHVIHISFNAAKMIESDDKPENMDILVDIPAGYSLPDETEPVTEMHLRTIVNQNDNDSTWLPIFLSYQNFINMFGGMFRMQLVTFKEVYNFIDSVNGIVIEPGALNLLLSKKKREQSENDNSEDLENDDSQSDEKSTTLYID